MSYETDIAAAMQVNMAELYHFEMGGEHWYLTSYFEDVVGPLGQTHTAIYIKRGAWSAGTSLEPKQIKINMGIVANVLEYISNYPIPKCAVTITQYFPSTGTYFVIFRGEVVSVVLVKDGAELACESAGILYTAKLPRFVHSAYCNHTLYDANCGLDENTYKSVLSSVTVSGSQITHATIGTKAAGYFQWGHAKMANGEHCMITKHTGTSVWLHVPFSGLATGGSVTLYAGCDKSKTTCRARFSNYDNSLMMPNIPCSNPVIFGV